MSATTDALDAYEEEQSKLRKQYDLEDDGEESDGFVQALPEVNPEVYKDVEPLLFQGFLMISAQINGQPFVFKSLNHHEFSRLSLQGSYSNVAALQNYYNRFLAYGVVLVGDTNVLANRDESLPELTEFFSSLPREAKQSVVRHLSEVNRRASRAVVLTEAYAIEMRSRLRWAQLKGLDLTSTAVSGFEGSAALGLNWGQLTWRAINYYEDQRETAEREWENTKFVASAMAGKGMNKIYSRDKRRRQDEQNQRVERRDRIIRYALLNEPLEGADRGVVMVARTVEELNAQMERDLRGEQDWHDRVIAQHEGRLHQDYEERFRQIQEMRERHLEQFGDRAIITNTDIKQGLTPQEVAQRIQTQQGLKARGQEALQRFAEFTDERQAKFADKWMPRRSSSQSPPSVIPAQTPARPQAKPFNGGRR